MATLVSRLGFDSFSQRRRAQVALLGDCHLTDCLDEGDTVLVLDQLLVSRVLDGDFTPLQTMPRLLVVMVPPQFTVPPGPYRDLRDYDENDPIRVRAVQMAVG